MAEVNTSDFSSTTNIVFSTLSALTADFSADSFASAVNGNSTAVVLSGIAPTPIWAGFLGCLVATIFFGSNLVPVKQFSVGDGLFFQMAFCVPVVAIGIIVDLILNNQRTYPLVFVGGMKQSSFIL